MAQQKLQIAENGVGVMVHLAPEEIAQREIDRAASLAADNELAAVARQHDISEDTKAALMQALTADLEVLEGGGALTVQQQREILARVVRVALTS